MKKLWVASLLAISLNTSHAQVEFAAAASIDSIITKISNSLSELISEAETSASVAAFSVAIDANVLLQNLEILGKELSGKVFSDLNDSQRSAITNAVALLDNTDRDLKERIADAQKVVNVLGGEISRLPFAKDRPLLASYSPSYILNKDSSYDISLTGSRLSTDEVNLEFGSQACERVAKTETSIRFTCPANIFDDNSNTWVSGKLSFQKEPPWYKFWGKVKNFEYEVGLMAIQEKMGTYSFSVSEKVNSNKRVNRSESRHHHNGHCKGNKSNAWQFTPTSSCKIDITSVKIPVKKTSAKSRFHGIKQKGPNGFQITATTINNGSCGPFGVPKDARGSVRFTTTWQDICPESNLVELPVQTGDIFWGEDLSFDLPENVQKFTLRVLQADGTVKIVNKTDSEKWFTSDYDTNAKMLVLKPRDIEKAFE